MKKKAIIISIKGTTLTKNEKLLLSKEKPWGLILFKRNIKSIPQIRNLIKDIKKFVKDIKFPILIDEEGSTVSRLKNNTDNVIEYNDGFSNEIKNDKPRNFWNLLKFK